MFTYHNFAATVLADRPFLYLDVRSLPSTTCDSTLLLIVSWKDRRSIRKQDETGGPKDCAHIDMAVDAIYRTSRSPTRGETRDK